MLSHDTPLGGGNEQSYSLRIRKIKLFEKVLAARADSIHIPNCSICGREKVEAAFEAALFRLVEAHELSRSFESQLGSHMLSRLHTKCAYHVHGVAALFGHKIERAMPKYLEFIDS
jgi:hypothetical protein